MLGSMQFAQGCEVSLIWLDTFGGSPGRVSKTSGNDPKTWDPEFGTWVSLDRGGELGPVSATRSGLGGGEKRSNMLQLWGALTHTPVLLCARFLGQGTPACSFGPNWAHKPSASWGERVRVCPAAQQDVANPGLYFFTCNSLCFVLLNTMAWERPLVQSANSALLCSLLLGGP